MKYTLFFGSILILIFNCKAQNLEKIIDYSEIIQVYKENCSPYFQEIAKAKYKNYDVIDEDRTQLINALYNLRISQVSLLSEEVAKKIELSDSLKTSPNNVISLLTDSYKSTFPELHEKFYKQVKSELKKKGV